MLDCVKNCVKIVHFCENLKKSYANILKLLKKYSMILNDVISIFNTPRR